MMRSRESRRHLLRLKGEGRRSVRPGHVVIDEDARAVGAVTSFSFINEEFDFVALAWVEEGFTPEPGVEVRAARLRRDRYSAPPGPDARVSLTALTRFPDDEERLSWAQERPVILL